MSRRTFATIARPSLPCPFSPRHDHENFEIICYADVARPDGITARLRSHADTWRNITGLSHEEVAAGIRQDGIDILVNLTMHMARNRLLVFARKPAPVQASWLAGDLPRLSGLRATLRDRLEASPLMNAPRFARNIEAAYHEMWRRWCVTGEGGTGICANDDE